MGIILKVVVIAIVAFCLGAKASRMFLLNKETVGTIFIDKSNLDESSSMWLEIQDIDEIIAAEPIGKFRIRVIENAHK